MVLSTKVEVMSRCGRRSERLGLHLFVFCSLSFLSSLSIDNLSQADKTVLETHCLAKVGVSSPM